jgi:antitoxin Phd
MATWQLQEAKAKLSEVIDTAKKKGPQIITQRGVKTAVVVPFDKWESRTEPDRRTLWKPGTPLTAAEQKENDDLIRLLQSAPEFEIPARSHMRMRKPVRF